MLIEENMLNFEQWIHKAIPQYHTQYPEKPPINCAQEINLLTRYLEDIATISTLTTNAPPKTWLLFATDYITDALLLNVIRKRTANYHPYVWDDKHQTRRKRRKQLNYLATSISMTACGKSYTQVALTTKLNATNKTSQYNGHPTTFAPISYRPTNDPNLLPP